MVDEQNRHEIIDPLISAAFSIHSNPGLYALLLGSGISRPAGILTGWEIVLDLIKKLAIIEGEDSGEEPEKWFYQKYKKKPEYSDLLKMVGKTGTERQGILRGYFEPSSERSDEGLKKPTKAHYSIARLVAEGYIKVIITTNFDKLLEKALQDVNVNPKVISTPDDAKGALSFTHSNCTIIKVNGDYLDIRVKNTPEELAKYSRAIKNLIVKVFTEYGLIVSGWSGDWDIALREIFKRTSNKKFTTYWCVRNLLGDVSNNLVNFRDAVLVENKDANSVFSELESNIFALKDISAQHPLTAKLAVAKMKIVILNDSKKIVLHDMVLTETENLCAQLSLDKFPINKSDATKENFVIRAKQYESSTNTLMHLFIHGCYWGNENTDFIFSKSLERVANNIKSPLSGPWQWIRLRLYPALILLYSGCITSLVNQKYHTFLELLLHTKLLEDENEYKMVTKLNIIEAVENQSYWSPGNTGNRFETSQHLYDLLREPLREYLPDEVEYREYFERFEYIQALISLDINENNRIPIGLYSHRTFISDKSTRMSKRIAKELIEQGSEWPLIKYGLFKNSVERVKELMKLVDGAAFQISHGF